MKALVKSKSERGLWLEEVPKPTIGINDVLIHVDRTGICGTDLHIFKWDRWAQKSIPVPIIIGHEFVGEIVEVGSNVKDFFPGQIVSGEGHVVCGHCRNCLAGRRHLCADTKGIGINRPGAFAEYLALPMTNVWVHNGIDLDIAAIFDPFGNAVHTALSFDVLGEDVLITGAGPIGIMAAAIVRHAGARFVVITDVNEHRLELARKMDATLAVNPVRRNLKEVQKLLGMKEGFDVGLEMSGSATAFRDMIDNMSHGGKIAVLGIPSEPIAIDWNKVIFNHCHPVQRCDKRLNGLQTKVIANFEGVSDMDSDRHFQPAKSAPNWRNACWKNNFFAGHGVGSPGAISPLCATLGRQPQRA